MSEKNKKDVGAIVHRSGVSFRVWAPFAQSVAVIGSYNNWAEVPMESEQDGYWSVFVRGAKPGSEYKFAIKNGDNIYRRNDPRALHFTTSAGNSVIANPNFDWGDDAFEPIPFNKQVIYEMHVGTFNRPDPAITGTFEDAIEKLGYLKDLGINMIELMPISSMLMDRGWGYAIDYIYSVESLYGGRHGFLQFVKAAHKHGIGVIMDVVYNHFGPDTSLDLWQFDGWHQDDKGGIYFYNDWRAETPWGNTRPDFGRAEVRQYIWDNVKMWLHDCRVDGLRVDSTIFIRNVKGYNDNPPTDLPEGWQLLQGINSVARKINPNAITIAEDLACNEFIVKPAGEGGADFYAQWELGFPFALRDALHTDNPGSINLTGICAQLGRRFNGDAFKRIIFMDSHDSAANGGSRLNESIAPGKADGLFARRQTLIAATLLMTAPGIPMIFQGQEFMQGGSFNDWQELDWSLSGKNAGIISAFNHLINLRRNVHDTTAGLLSGNINLTHVNDGDKVIGFHRWEYGGAGDDVMVVINFGNRTIKNYEMNFPRKGTWHVRFNSTWAMYSHDFKDFEVHDIEVETGGAMFDLPPSCALIFSQDE
ncbi:MAG TPA: alpha-amylase family glycosyl hydrolase [Candidatus Saccharimonadales bacterium]|nr:alpha-amylase family glycosyl hydrolase [Candidatus Saccharimonadales bacterium]